MALKGFRRCGRADRRGEVTPKAGTLCGTRLFHVMAATTFIPLAWLALHRDTLEPCSPVCRISKQPMTACLRALVGEQALPRCYRMRTLFTLAAWIEERVQLNIVLIPHFA